LLKKEIKFPLFLEERKRDLKKLKNRFKNMNLRNKKV
jgi:hypothetical protein